MNAIKRIIWRVVLGFVLLAVVLAGAATYYAKGYLPGAVAPRSFPQVDGQLQLAGLEQPVDIYRDAWGVPHIYAASVHDLFFAQGFVHAQERFWQMDTWRHIGSGRLAEMFGEGAVETDAFLRTLGWRRVSERELSQLQPDSRLLLEAYAQGVNAYLKDREPTAVSLEYAVLKLLNPGYKIEPWEPVHSMTWAKAMAWDLRGNLDEEIERAILLKTLGPERVEELFPAYPPDHPTIVRSANAGSTAGALRRAGMTDLPDGPLASVQHNAALLSGLLGPGRSGAGSNSWVLAGSRTVSGMPLFANDPHLSSQMPSIWYQVDMHCKPKTEACPYSFAGFSFAGVPGIVIGHNDDIVWGMTNLSPDVMDLFIERVNPENPDQYEMQGQWVDFEKSSETLQVAGQEPVQLEIRSTRHGPVISTVYGDLKDEIDGEEKDFVPFRERAGVTLPEDYVITLAWTALKQPSPFEALWGMTRAQNWDEFREAVRKFEIAPQNLLFADVRGNIGYQMPGDIPIRAGGDGRFPVPGWSGEYDWIGYIPFEDQPHVFNPEEGYLATANNRVAPPEYPYLISTDWDNGFRAKRIQDLIEAAPGKVDATYMQTMQADTLDPIAPILVPLVLKVVPAQDGTEAGLSRQALQVLSAWDFRADADSSGASVFEVFWRHLLQDTFDDELPKDFRAEGGDRWMEVVRKIADDPDSRWWDDQTTPEVVETRDQILARAFGAAVQELSRQLGQDVSTWSWGKVHTVTFENGTLGTSGVGLIEDLFNRGPFAVGGGESILNATGWDASESYAVDWLPSMRMIVDLADLQSSLTVHTTGQSGHAFHPHYVDMVPLWAAGEYYPMLWSESAVRQDSAEHLTLTP